MTWNILTYLPVMDYRNNSIAIEKVTSMDVNTAIQRSTAKAIAMHGLGLIFMDWRRYNTNYLFNLPSGK